MFFDTATSQLKIAAERDFSLVGLKAAIIIIALVFIAAALVIQNKLTLAAMLAYLLLP
jgi:hypothetical protein